MKCQEEAERVKRCHHQAEANGCPDNAVKKSREISSVNLGANPGVVETALSRHSRCGYHRYYNLRLHII